MNNVQTSAVHKQLNFKSGWLTRMMWPNGGKNIPIASFEIPFQCSLWYNETNEFKVAIDKVDVGWTYRFYLQRFWIEQWFQSRQKFAIQNAKSFKVSKFFKCNDWINIHEYIWNVFLMKKKQTNDWNFRDTTFPFPILLLLDTNHYKRVHPQINKLSQVRTWKSEKLLF